MRNTKKRSATNSELLNELYTLQKDAIKGKTMKKLIKRKQLRPVKIDETETRYKKQKKSTLAVFISFRTEWSVEELQE